MGITGGIEWDELIRPLRDVSEAAVCSLYIFIVIAVFAVLNVLTAPGLKSAVVPFVGIGKDALQKSPSTEQQPYTYVNTCIHVYL